LKVDFNLLGWGEVVESTPYQEPAPIYVPSDFMRKFIICNQAKKICPCNSPWRPIGL
jgi:hypothetical protein